MKQRITYIISDIGKALAFEWIADRLNSKQFSLSFILLNPGPSALEDFLKKKDVPVHRITCRGKKDWPAAFLQICRLLRGRPDVVHCHLLQASVLGLSAAKLMGIRRRIYTRHHSDFHFRYFPKGVKWDRWCNSMATTIVAPSQAVRHVLTDMEGVPPGKVQIIHHGFDIDYFQQVSEAAKARVKKQYNPEGRRPVVGVISRFTALKGIQYIIPAFSALLQTHPNALLLLFNASGDYKAELDTQLAALPQGSFRTVTFEADLAAVYPLFDVFVQASTDTNIEAFGQTYVEALAAGVPSVFTLSGIAQDFIVDRENALVVPFKDATAIHKALELILNDAGLRARLINKGKESVVHTFALPQMIRQLECLYTAHT